MHLLRSRNVLYIGMAVPLIPLLKCILIVAFFCFNSTTVCQICEMFGIDVNAQDVVLLFSLTIGGVFFAQGRGFKPCRYLTKLSKVLFKRLVLLCNQTKAVSSGKNRWNAIILSRMTILSNIFLECLLFNILQFSWNVRNYYLRKIM